jgi:hypothetical protein
MVTFSHLGKLGRFGNQLFQYAGTKLYAQLNNFSFACPGWIGSDVFENVKPYTVKEYFVSRFYRTYQLNDFKELNKLARIKRGLGLLKYAVDMRDLYQHPKDNVDILGYMQDPLNLELIAKHKNLVRSWFGFKKEINDSFKDATAKYEPWIGVHIRRGDMVKRGLIVPIEKYIEFLAQHKDKKIYISSDDPQISQAFSNFNIIRPINPMPDIPNFVFDFWMLANADMIVGCGSTFSWWAAYSGNRNNYYSPPLIHLWPKDYKPILNKIEI